MPVLTTFDPDGVVGDADVGLVCADEAELQQALARLIADDGTYQALSRRAERFFSETFRTDIIVRQHLDNLLAVEQERPA